MNGPICQVCGHTSHKQVSATPDRFECDGCAWLWFRRECKVPGCAIDAEPGSKVCPAHFDRQCAAMHGSKYSGATLGDAAGGVEYQSTMRMPTRTGPYVHRQCWNLVKVPGSLCWRHRVRAALPRQQHERGNP